MNRIRLFQPISFDHLLEPFKISKNRIALIALFALSCLALAYAMCRWMHFKADKSEDALPDDSGDVAQAIKKRACDHLLFTGREDGATFRGIERLSCEARRI